MGVGHTILSTFFVEVEFCFVLFFLRWKGRREYFRYRRQKGCDTNILGVVKKNQNPMGPEGKEWQRAGTGHGTWEAAPGRLWAEEGRTQQRPLWELDPDWVPEGRDWMEVRRGVGRGGNWGGGLEIQGYDLWLWTWDRAKLIFYIKRRRKTIPIPLQENKCSLTLKYPHTVLLNGSSNSSPEHTAMERVVEKHTSPWNLAHFLFTWDHEYSCPVFICLIIVIFH